jgi:hypothetical protein
MATRLGLTGTPAAAASGPPPASPINLTLTTIEQVSESGFDAVITVRNIPFSFPDSEVEVGVTPVIGWELELTTLESLPEVGVDGRADITIGTVQLQSQSPSIDTEVRNVPTIEVEVEQRLELVYDQNHTLTTTELEPDISVQAETAKDIDIVLTSVETDSWGRINAVNTVADTAKFIHTGRSQSSNILMGVNAGPFKLNHALTTYKRGSKVNVLHLSVVKPVVVTVQADFKMIIPIMYVESGEFSYKDRAQYLKIENDALVDGVMAQDGDTEDIPVLLKDNDGRLITGIQARRVSV